MARQRDKAQKKQPNLRGNVPEVGLPHVGLLQWTMELLIWLRVVVLRYTLFSDVIKAMH